MAVTPKGSSLHWVLSEAVPEPEFGVGSVTQGSWVMLCQGIDLVLGQWLNSILEVFSNLNDSVIVQQ